MRRLLPFFINVGCCVAVLSLLLVLGLRTIGDTHRGPQLVIHADGSRFDISDSHVIGSPGAPVALVEFADFECPYCGVYAREVFPTIVRDFINRGDVQYFFLNYPLPQHRHAVSAAQAAECAAYQNAYWEANRWLFDHQDALGDPSMTLLARSLNVDEARFHSCLRSIAGSALAHALVIGQTARVVATPTFFIGSIHDGGVFHASHRITGSQPYTVFHTAIKDSLTAAARGN